MTKIIDVDYQCRANFTDFISEYVNLPDEFMDENGVLSRADTACVIKFVVEEMVFSIQELKENVLLPRLYWDVVAEELNKQ